jgi:hypothetical protein
MVFGLSSGEHCCSPAIICHRVKFITASAAGKADESGKQESRKGNGLNSENFLPSCFPDSFLWSANLLTIGSAIL